MVFKLACVLCDTGSPVSLDDAVEEGWIGLERDAEAANWSHLGYCPDCQASRPDDCAGVPVLGPGALL